jgi:hypothetical protein
MDAFPSAKFQLKGFEPGRRGCTDHLVRDDVLLGDERPILRLQRSKLTALFNPCMAH